MPSFMLSRPLLEAQPERNNPFCGYSQEMSQSTSFVGCRQALQGLQDGSQGGSDEFIHVNEWIYSNAFYYKGRPIFQATMLHVAIHLEAVDQDFDGVVSKLIKVRADMEAKNARAIYKADKFDVSLHAITLAAGMGSVPVLQALTNGFTQEQIKQLLVRDDLSTSGGEPFYTPLHDACFLGKTSTTLWLLKHGAPADKADQLNMTPLHLFPLSGNFDEPGDVEKTVKELVRCKAPLAKKAELKGSFCRRWGECALTPLEVAAQHDVNFPRDVMRFLAPSFQLLLKDEADPDLAEPDAVPPQAQAALGRRRSFMRRRSFIKSESMDIGVSFFNDLLMLCKKSSHAAEKLAKDILEVSEERGCAPIVRQRLLQDAQQPDAVGKLVRLMTASPNAAASMLKVMMQAPAVQVPTHYPILMRTSLWGPLVNTPMRCEYMPDASKSKDGVLIPQWFYTAVCQWHPSWHDDFVPRVDDIRDAGSAYDVNVTVLPVPDILHVDFIQALACVDPVSCYRVFACKPVQGIVTCMWQTLIQHVYSVEILLALVDVGVLLSWGLTTGTDGPFSRLWETARLESPRAAPLSWAWLTGTCARECLALLCWFFGYMGRWYLTGGLTKTLEGLPFSWPGLKRLPSSDTYMGTWSFSWLLLSSHFLIELLMVSSLIAFVVQVLESDERTEISPTTQAVLALNVFLRFLKLLVSLSVIRAFGARIIAVLSSMVSGAMREMLFISTMVFVAFQMVFLVLRREHSATWTAIYLYRGLLFGDGDGLDRFGIADELGALKKEGDVNQHQWSSFYGVLATITFNIVILNLIIAIYSDEYKEQQKRAPMVFVQQRAKICASSMLKYHTLGWLIPAALTRWGVLLFIVIAWFLWSYGQCSWDDGYRLEAHVRLMTHGGLMGIVQIALLLAVGHMVILPAESSLKSEPAPPRKLFEGLRACPSRLGVHSSVPPQASCRRRASPMNTLRVKHAKLLSSHCLEVQIAVRKAGESTEGLRVLCKEAVLFWSTGTQCGAAKPIPSATSHRIAVDGCFEATLLFEPVMNIWGPLHIRVGGLVQQVRLPRFLWICCRDDFEDVDGPVGDIDTSALLREVHGLDERMTDLVEDLREQLVVNTSATRDAQGRLEEMVNQEFPKKFADLVGHAQYEHSAVSLKKPVEDLVVRQHLLFLLCLSRTTTCRRDEKQFFGSSKHELGISSGKAIVQGAATATSNHLCLGQGDQESEAAKRACTLAWPNLQPATSAEDPPSSNEAEENFMSPAESED